MSNIAFQQNEALDDYFKRHGLSNTLWAKRIYKASRNGCFSFADFEEACDWVTCACGQTSIQILYDEFGRPEDERLQKFGSEFQHAVATNHFHDAARTLAKIERRAREVALS